MGEKHLRITIDKAWSTNKFERIFAEINAVYEIALVCEKEDQPFETYWFYPQRRLYDRSYFFDLRPEYAELVKDEILDTEMRSLLRIATEGAPPLQVKQIKFASPGFFDLVGIGKAFESLSGFVLGVTDRVIGRKDRALDRQLKEQEIFRAKIENAERVIGLAERHGIDEETRRRLLRRVLDADRRLENGMIEGRITGSSLEG